MNEFLHTALTFPTLPWSIFFAFCALYWLLAATGLVGHHSGDSGHVHHHAHTDHSGHADDAGMLARFGLDGVPLMLMLVVLSFVGWVVVYLTQLLVLDTMPAGVRPLGNLLACVLALVPAVLFTSVLLRPLRRVFRVLEPDETKRIVGRVGIVITPVVDSVSGMAQVDDGGAGLLLQVRAPAGQQFRRGQRVVLLEYRPADNIYLVTPEDQF